VAGHVLGHLDRAAVLRLVMPIARRLVTVMRRHQWPANRPTPVALQAALWKIRKTAPTSSSVSLLLLRQSVQSRSPLHVSNPDFKDDALGFPAKDRAA
jgi:hypothetical protein